LRSAATWGYGHGIMPPAKERIRPSAPRILAALALVIGSLAAFAPSAAAADTCKVKNPRTKHSYIGSGSDLQTAIDEAVPGTNLIVMGVCQGTFIIGAKLALTGRATGAYPTPTLDGNGAGTVLTVTAGSVKLKDLTITGGSAPISGGGILNHGTLTLNGSMRVSGDAAGSSGGGIDNSGALTLKASASVSGSSAQSGGGIFNSGTLTLDGSSSVSGNAASSSGGGIFNSGTLTLKSSAVVSGNTAGAGGGGGILDSPGLGVLHACTTWSGVLAPNAPNDPPAPILVFC